MKKKGNLVVRSVRKNNETMIFNEILRYFGEFLSSFIKERFLKPDPSPQTDALAYKKEENLGKFP